MKRIYLYITICFFALSVQAQQLDKTVENRLKEFFQNYTTSYFNIGTTRLKSIQLDNERRQLAIYPDTNFGYQSFTNENVEAIYRSVKQLLPGPVNYYDITIFVDNKPIEELIPNALRKRSAKDKTRLWNNIDYKGDAWVKNTSKPYEATSGLEGRHIAVHQSHGKYFKNEKGEWTWQRPPLFCTTEDLFTQSFVVPYIIPMLENAGAVVFTARERDWQPNEVIVDNDASPKSCIYYEEPNKRSKWQIAPTRGFAQLKSSYLDNENPFRTGSARYTTTATKKKSQTFAEWIPNIPQTGRYAVYVSYQTLPQSISDAKYLVFHKGGVTEFSVNQKIGGGTWVYLGTFEFDKGNNDYGMVVLSNESKQKGVVCADAVRFGGGMGKIARNASSSSPATTSGVPRYLEGARYNAQWSGMPYSVYGGREGTNDYADDINTRSNMLNYLSGGSVYNPTQEGLKVPFELSISIHSDAGFSKEDKAIGPLGIYTTDFNDGKLGAGISRYASRDLNDMVLSGLQKDLSAALGFNWTPRGMWNRNYSESRVPAVPSMILETLSHQNFTDMKLGHDPHFKFALGRSVYKSILKYVASMHQKEYVVQPLPIENFAIQFEGKKNQVKLSWTPVDDPLEPTATPREYIVYTRIGFGGFDNGELVKGTSFIKELEPELVYSFKVTAVNKGGESFPSEILSAYYTKKSKGTILIVNGFNRLSGPEVIETGNLQGFNLRQDIGVPYLRTPEYCGEQTGLDRAKIGIETEGGLGYSSNELEGKLIAGNTFDYPFIHGKAIQAVGGYSFVSCSSKAIEEGIVRPGNYPIIDYILGVEKQPFTSSAQQWITSYCRLGGKLFISGSFVNDENATAFTSQTLKFTSGGNRLYAPSNQVMGTGIQFSIYRTPNEESYAVPSPASILPVSPAFAAFAYTPDNVSAGIAYKGAYRTFILGFPFESVQRAKDRAHIMAGILHYFE